VFANAAPDVTLFARDFRAPRSLRSNLSWSGPVLGNRFTANARAPTRSTSTSRASSTATSATSRASSSRPRAAGRCSCSPASIVPATGAVAWRDTRVAPQFARVAEQRSDLRSDSRPAAGGDRPASFNTGVSWSLSYVYGGARAHARLLQHAGDPRAFEWSPAALGGRHQVNYTLFANLSTRCA
jgi:hypothetical protein